MTIGFKALFATTLLLCVFLQTFTEAKKIPFPQSIVQELAKRSSRIHHYTWHIVRDFWNLLTPEQQQELTDLGWAPTNPSLTYDAKGVPTAIMDNYAGEDFLFMHREMVHQVNKMLAEKKEPYGKIVGWKKIPAPGDKDYPVPAPYQIPGEPGFFDFIQMVKSDEFYWNVMKPAEEMFTNPDALRKMTLSEMGTRMESTIHAWMHMRFSTPSTVGYRAAQITMDNALKPIDAKWDNVKYDWLGDPFSSQAHPTFWLLHGWVDDRIEDWRKAHGLCTIKWKGTWVGTSMSESCDDNAPKKPDGGLRGTPQPSMAETMEKVCDVFNRAGLGKTRFDCNVRIPERTN